MASKAKTIEKEAKKLSIQEIVKANQTLSKTFRKLMAKYHCKTADQYRTVRKRNQVFHKNNPGAKINPKLTNAFA